jgi:hypothetical protein
VIHTLSIWLLVGAIIIVAASLTVLRHREYSHLAPLGLFLALIALAAFPPGSGL